MERHLDTTCKETAGTCHGECRDVARQAADGRWFITITHSGFNSPRNNRDGYRSEALALAASGRYGARS